VAVLALVVATLAAMGGVVRNEFTWWDDQDTIHHNPDFNPPSGKAILKYWKEPKDGLYIPVTQSMWGGLAFIAETKQTDANGIHLDARVYHAASLAIHLIAVLVLFRILRLLGGGVWPACAGAMLFALHPVQVETVAWASGGKDVLFGMLSLCAIHQYVMFARAKRGLGEGPPPQPSPGVPGEGENGAQPVKGRPWLYFTTGLVLLVLAMLSKPTAVVVPVIVAAIDWLLIRRHWKKVAVSAGVWLAAAVPCAVITRLVQDSWRVAPVAWWNRPLIAADAVAFYLWKLVWPVGLGPDYGRRPQAVLEMWGGAWVQVVWIVPVAVGLWVWFGRRSRPWAVVGAVAFLAGVGPVLGFTPFMFQYTSSVTDHYLYLSMFGPALVLTWALMKYRSQVTRLGCGAGLAALALLSMLQVRVWRDDLTLWAHNTKVAPRTFVAHNNLASALGRRAASAYQQLEHATTPLPEAERERLARERRECLEMAVEALRRGLAVNPDHITSHRNGYVNALRLGDRARAVYHVEQMLRCSLMSADKLEENYIPFREVAAKLHIGLENYEKAAQHYEEILRRLPDHQSARVNLEGIRKKMAEARVEF
jgi:hypothetical protein